MTIEIAQRSPCPKCRGRGTVTAFRLKTNTTGKKQCSDCHGRGTVPRALATFADASALLNAIDLAIDIHAAEIDNARSVLAALGVSDDQG